MRRHFKRIVIEGPYNAAVKEFVSELRIYFGKHNRGSVKFIKMDRNYTDIWLEVDDRERIYIGRVQGRNPSLKSYRAVFWGTWHRMFGWVERPSRRKRKSL